jgi:chromosomal replication initiation ATPase DnaA
MGMLGGEVMDQKLNLLQYTLPIIQAPDFTSYSYFVSHSNQDAYQLIESWPNWPFKRCIISGPSGYGKTHLGHILKDLIQGVFLDAQELTEDMYTTIRPNTYYIIDNIQAVQDPKLLFHFYNLTLENDCIVVYLSEMAPGKMDTNLADLNSRLRSLPVIELSQPDEELCRAIIKKIFSDLQINVSEEIIQYLMVHTSRNLSDIQLNLKALNQRSLEEKRNITIPFIKNVLKL